MSLILNNWAQNRTFTFEFFNFHNKADTTTLGSIQVNELRLEKTGFFAFGKTKAQISCAVAPLFSLHG